MLYIQEWSYLKVNFRMLYSDIIMKVFIYGFFKCILIGGLLFVSTSIIYVFITKKRYIFVLNTIFIIVYGFGILKFLPFDYSLGVESEFLNMGYYFIPLTIGVYAGIIPVVEKGWKGILIFFKLFLLQSLCLFIIGNTVEFIISDYSPSSFTELLGDLITSFFRTIEIGGLLFVATSLTYILVKNKIQVAIFNLIWILLYLFVFFEYVLDIGDIYKELLIPLTIAVYSPFLFFLIHKYKKKNENIIVNN